MVVAGMACGGSVDDKADGSTEADAAASATATSTSTNVAPPYGSPPIDAGSDTSAVAMYGAPPPDASAVPAYGLPAPDAGRD